VAINDARAYDVICSCGYQASKRTVGQAAAELPRHVDDNPDLNPHFRFEG